MVNGDLLCGLRRRILQNAHLPRRAVARGVAYEAAWIGAGQVLGAVGALVGVRLLTSVLDVGSYGDLSLAFTGATMVSQIIIGPLGSAAERFLAPALEQRGFRSFVVALTQLMAGAVALVGFVGAPLLALAATRAGPAALATTGLAIAFAIVSGIEAILDGLQNAARQRAVVAFHQLLRPWLRALFAFGCVTLLGANAQIALMGYLVGSGLTLASQAALWRRFVRAAAAANDSDALPVQAVRGQILAFALPFAWWGAFTWAHLSADRWALEWFRDSTAVGTYAVVFQLGTYPLTLLGTVLVQLVSPIVYARAGQGTDRVRVRSASVLAAWLAAAMLAATLGLTVVAALAHELVYTIAVGQSSFRAAAALLPLAVLASGAFNVGQILSLVPLAAGTSNVLIAPKIGTAVLSVALSLMGARLFGVPGVLVGGIIFGSFYAAWAAWIAYPFTRSEPRRAGVSW